MERVDYTKMREFSAPRTYLQENVFLGSMIMSPFFIREASNTIDESCFEGELNRKLWKILREMDSRGDEITVASVLPRIDTENFTKNILPVCRERAILELANITADLKTATVRRQAYFTGYSLIQGAVSGKEINEIIDIPTSFLKSVEASIRTDDTVIISKILTELGNVLEKRETERLRGKKLRITTSFSTLDWMTYGGFTAGNLVILAARPSVGKTAVALQMARAASSNGSAALFFSLEMTNIELAQRMLSSTQMISTLDMVKGDIDWTAFEEASGKFSDVPLWFNDKATTVDEIVNKISSAHKKGQCDIAFIDYLGLISHRDGSKSLYQQVTETTRRLKIAAKENDVPIVLLCQLNRESVSGGKKHPDLHDLRDSGSIEQDADIVLMLEANDEGTLSMWIRKNRQGRKGDALTLQPDDNYTNFIEL